ncbi:MAG: hypothetical protein PUE95_11900 [Lachnospiraceae bacterium]|nr:hypothetical protein [Lachnospiraceae bacterium]
MDAKKVVGAFVGMVLRVTIAIFVLYYLYQTAINAYNFGYRIFADLPCAIAPGRDIQVTVTESMDEKAMAKEFEKVGLVEDWKLFWVQTLLSEYKEDLKPGIYTLNNSMNSEELLAAVAGAGEEDEDGETSDGNADLADPANETLMNNADDEVVPEFEGDQEDGSDAGEDTAQENE